MNKNNKNIFRLFACCFKQKLPTYIETPEPITEPKNDIHITPTWENSMPFVPPIKNGYVIKVYDGDTITVASKLPYLGSPLYRFPVRLNGIDCPEMKSKNDTEKMVAKMAQQKLTELIYRKIVRLENVQTEKYGRLLADVYIDNLHINKIMIDNRLAVSYDGGTKVTPKNWLEYHQNK